MQQHYRGQVDDSRKADTVAKRWTICGIVSGVLYVSVIILLVLATYGVAFGISARTNEDVDDYVNPYLHGHGHAE